MQPKKYLQYVFPVFNTKRTKEIFHVNPVVPQRTEPEKVSVYVFDYNENQLHACALQTVEEAFAFKDNNNVTWINIDGLRKADVEKVCQHFNIHPLLAEDILSIGQRPKADEIENVMYCLLNMLYFNDQQVSVEQEQISIVLGQNFLISFQEDASRDVFNGIREKLKLNQSKLRVAKADYLCYALIDMIVDHYFVVMEKLSDKIEMLEEEIIRYADTKSLARINNLRKEMIVLKRNVTPVRDLINSFIRSESELLDARTIKYFKDVHDHIVQAVDMVDNYRDMMINMQDLYLNKANMKLNEVMKVMAIVTCLLAPATVIGGIFGMNFDRIPWLHNHNGFFITVAVMLIVPIWMIWVFKKRGWF